MKHKDIQTILVTGSAGYIGSHVVLTLLDNGHHVIGIDNLSNSYKPTTQKNYTFYNVDIANQSKIAEILKAHPNINACIHLAGSIYIDESYQKPDWYYKNNVLNHKNFVEQITSTNIKNIIYSSSASVYGIGHNNPMNEGAKLDPIHPYGKTKLQAEQHLKEIVKNANGNFVILRYFNVAGADSKMRTGQNNKRPMHLINVLCDYLVTNKSHFTINGDNYDTPDGTCIRDYIHVSDLANIHYLAVKYLHTNGRSETLNCGYGKGYSIKEIINAIEMETGRNIKYKIGKNREGDVAHLVAQTTKVYKTLNWTPEHNCIGTILKSAFEWECKKYKHVTN